MASDTIWPFSFSCCCLGTEMGTGSWIAAADLRRQEEW
jgi:hypothetical protein